MKNKWMINFGMNEKQKKSSYAFDGSINGTTTLESHWQNLLTLNIYMTLSSKYELLWPKHYFNSQNIEITQMFTKGRINKC